MQAVDEAGCCPVVLPNVLLCHLYERTDEEKVLRDKTDWTVGAASVAVFLNLGIFAFK